MPNLMGMSPLRLRVGALLDERGMTAYQLAQQLEGRVNRSTVYRLARGEVTQVPLDVLEVLVDVFGLNDAGPLFDRSTRDGKRCRR